MSAKRQPSKQKRQAQNRAQRAALEARRAAAAQAERDAASQSGGRSARPSGSFLSRLRGGQGAGSPTGRTSAIGTPSGLPVGHRAALSAVLAAVAAVFAAVVLIQVPVDADGEPFTSLSRSASWIATVAEASAEAPDATPAELVDAIGDDWSPTAEQERLAVAYWPLSLTYLLPIVGTAIGFRAVSKRASARTVNRTVFVTVFGALLTSTIFLLFLPAVISLGVAAFQIRKVEIAEARAAADAPPGDDPGADGDVIEAEATDGFDDDADALDADEAPSPADDDEEWPEGEHPPG